MLVHAKGHDGDLWRWCAEVLHNLICSGFPDWEDYRAAVTMATNVSPHRSPHELRLPVAVNTHGKQCETFLHVWLLVRFDRYGSNLIVTVM